MKPLLIEFQAFGPYAGHEVIDFKELLNKGLFLICGETGSGKTMLLDAMTFALYGKSSGNGRNDFEANRCMSADYDTPTFVKFVFETAGQEYVFERRLERKRKNLSASYTMMKKDDDGVWQPLGENLKDKDLNNKARELIGLEYDQFRQVIILPQGQFEKLLTSNSDEKEKILSDIFGEKKWQKIADKFYEEASARKDELKLVKERIRTSLAEVGCENKGELKSLIEHKEDEYKYAVSSYEANDYDSRRKALNDELLIARRFGDMHKVEGRLNELKSESSKRDAWEVELGRALKAEDIRGLIDEWESSEQTASTRRKDLEAIIQEEESIASSVDECAARIKALANKQGEIDEIAKSITLMESRVEDYESIDSLRNEYNRSQKEYDAKAEELEEARQKNEAYVPVIDALQREYKALDAEHRCMLETYLCGISAVLASGLEEGTECPVCGSIHHPKKAELSIDSVTKEAVDAKKKQSDDKYAMLQDSLLKQSQMGKIYEDKAFELATADTKLAQAKTLYEQMSSNLIDGIDSLDALQKSIADASASVKEYADNKKALDDKYIALKETLSGHKSKIESAQNELKLAEKKLSLAYDNLNNAIGESIFKSHEDVIQALSSLQERNNLQDRIARYDAELEAVNRQLLDMQAELEGKTYVEESLIQSKIDELDVAIKEQTEIQTLLRSSIQSLTDKLALIDREGDGIDEACMQAEEDFTFAKKLRGDTGTGLQRYVLGIMFSSVVAAANKMLELVHDGRYHLYRSDDKVSGSNKRGLELKVYDKYSDDTEGRFVNSLSGGEKFLVSLALSIGMSTIAQKSGIKIEALFIDEGFGSLDESSIVDAMNVLNTVQEANGLVGIISHVQLLRDRIPTKLIISKKEGRSHITCSVG